MKSDMKKSQYRIICSITGIIIGLFIGLGILNQTKQSQRETIALYAISGGVLIGLIGGYGLGDKLDTEEYVGEVLGIKKAETEYYKSGRSWIISTKWIDSNNKEYLLITGQNNDKILVSQLNEEVIVNHEIQSGSKVNVEKHHQNARNYVFAKLRADFNKI